LSCVSEPSSNHTKKKEDHVNVCNLLYFANGSIFRSQGDILADYANVQELG